MQSIGAVPAPQADTPAHASGRAWTGWLAPSFSDCFVIALLAWLFIFGASGWKSLLMDGDTGWHIRTGEYILNTHAVPTRDLFSFSKPGEPWFAWEWLSDVLLAVLFRMGGLKAVALGAAAVIGAFAGVLLRYTIWRGANGLVAAFATLIGVGSATIHFLARPHLFTLLFLPVCIWILEADRRSRTRLVWTLIPITALWTNLHGGFAVFLVCLALAVAGAAIECRLGHGSWSVVRRYALLLGGCTAASLLNPYGIQLHLHMLEYLRSDWIRNIVQEFQAPTFRSESQLQFEGLLLAALILTGFLLRRQRVTESLWIVFLAHSSLLSARHAPLFAAVAAPLVAAEFSAWWKSVTSGSKKSSVVRILYQMGEDMTRGFRWNSLWPAFLIIALAFLDAPLKWPRQFPSEGFPVRLVEENRALLESGRLLTTDSWGGYLIFRSYPRQRVFVDGRSDFYGETLGRDYLHLLQGAYDWQVIIQKYQFDVALLPVELPLTSLLKQDRWWQVKKDDGRAVLLIHLGQQRLIN